MTLNVRVQEEMEIIRRLQDKGRDRYALWRRRTQAHTNEGPNEGIVTPHGDVEGEGFVFTRQAEFTMTTIIRRHGSRGAARTELGVPRVWSGEQTTLDLAEPKV